MNKGESNERESMKNGIRINKHWKDKARIVKKRSTILQKTKMKKFNNN